MAVSEIQDSVFTNIELTCLADAIGNRDLSGYDKPVLMSVYEKLSKKMKRQQKMCPLAYLDCFNATVNCALAIYA